jgi:hypothetical protein
MKRKHKKVVGPKEKMLAYAAEAEARKMAKELNGSDGLWELFLIEAYRRCAGLPPLPYDIVEKP